LAQGLETGQGGRVGLGRIRAAASMDVSLAAVMLEDSVPSMGALALPEELILRCLRPLPAVGSHFALSTSCRALREVAKDDRLWGERLARDFPLASRVKPPGTLHRVYRMLAKSQLNTRQRRRGGIGPASVWGEDDFPYDTCGAPAEDDAFELPPQRSMAAPEIRRLAARFAEMNTDLDAHIPVRHEPVVIARRQRPPTGAPPPPPPVPMLRTGANTGTGPARAALLEEIRSRGAPSGGASTGLDPRAALFEAIRSRAAAHEQ